MREMDELYCVGDVWAEAHGIAEVGVTTKCLIGHLVITHGAVITHCDECEEECGYVHITAQVWCGPEVKLRIPVGTYMVVSDGDDMFKLFDLIVRSHINEARREAEEDAE